MVFNSHESYMKLLLTTRTPQGCFNSSKHQSILSTKIHKAVTNNGMKFMHFYFNFKDISHELRSEPH